MGMKKAICKWCGAENQKDNTKNSIVCHSCGKETTGFLVQPWRKK